MCALISGCAAWSMSRGGRLLEQPVQVQTPGHWSLPGCRGQWTIDILVLRREHYLYSSIMHIDIFLLCFRYYYCAFWRYFHHPDLHNAAFKTRKTTLWTTLYFCRWIQSMRKSAWSPAPQWVSHAERLECLVLATWACWQSLTHCLCL